MTDFMEEFAQQLSAGAGTEIDLPEGSKNRLLALARVVAHNSERKNAPLATFVLGRYVEARIRAGVDAEEALTEAISTAEALLSPEGGGVRPA